MNTHDRDRSMEMLLRSHRSDDGATLSQECLDAETLAAWMDGELPKPVRHAAERHAAGCARCQALLASMARTESEIEARPWWSAITAKWLVPVAAVATAVVVWVSVERARFNPATPPAPQAIDARDGLSAGPANAPAAPVLPPSGQDKSAQTAQQLADAPDRGKKLEAVQHERIGTRDAAREPKLAAPLQPVPGVVGGVSARELDALQPTGRAAADAAARSAAPPAAPPPAVPSEPVATPVPVPAVPSLQEKAAAPQAVAEAVTVAPGSPARAFGAGTGGGRGVSAPVEIRSPESRYRWRIIPPAGIQRSTDNGVTWAVVDPIESASSAGNRSSITLAAGSAPARDICWIVGRGGMVLLTTDGATWTRRPFPEAVDLAVVRAVSASSAEVTAGDGRRFATADGGVTWTPMK
jgi:hypothetical protein